MPATDTVNVAIQAKTLYGLPLWVAEQKGFFTEEGIAVKVEVILDSELIKERLRSGGLHLSVASSEIVLIEAFETGALRIVGGNACKPPLCLIAQPRIKTLADLPAATIDEVLAIARNKPGALSYGSGAPGLLAVSGERSRNTLRLLTLRM